MSRFIGAIAVEGRLLVHNISTREPWDAARLHIQDERTVDDAIRANMADRKIATINDLDRTLRDSRKSPAEIALWVDESPVDALRERWRRDREREP